jgi:hypothetical protein
MKLKIILLKTNFNETSSLEFVEKVIAHDHVCNYYPYVLICIF